ncbi:hypothetical protein L484_017310 [Morus notabilis]|uniref:Uncharacterized protein n=1 Tax=Morus notabilis TaxID=981085 RepID=W9S3F3_9ROSA|nr:hypothetical protein L484_017310 [Morus notabilis]
MLQSPNLEEAGKAYDPGSNSKPASTRKAALAVTGEKGEVEAEGLACYGNSKPNCNSNEEGNEGFKTSLKYLKPIGSYKVSDLFNNDGNWNESKVCALFSVEEVAAVLAIPLTTQSIPDRWIWRATSKRDFSVKTTYWLECSDRIQGSLYETQTLPQSTEFLFFTSSALEVIWKAKNNLVFQGLEVDPLHSFRQVQKQFQENHHLLTLPVIHSEASKEWQAPPPGWIKVNVDCSVHHSTSVVAAVGRDSNRNLVMAATSLIKTKDPLVAEWRLFASPFRLPPNQPSQQYPLKVIVLLLSRVLLAPLLIVLGLSETLRWIATLSAKSSRSQNSPGLIDRATLRAITWSSGAGLPLFLVSCLRIPSPYFQGY